jgi:hypothetical protein
MNWHTRPENQITVQKDVPGCSECKNEYALTSRGIKERHKPHCSRYVCRRCYVYRVDKCPVCGSGRLP